MEPVGIEEHEGALVGEPGHGHVHALAFGEGPGPDRELGRVGVGLDHPSGSPLGERREALGRPLGTHEVRDAASSSGEPGRPLAPEERPRPLSDLLLRSHRIRLRQPTHDGGRSLRAHDATGLGSNDEYPNNA